MMHRSVARGLRRLLVTICIVTAVACVACRLDAQHDIVQASQRITGLGEGGPVVTVVQPRLRKATGDFRLSYAPSDEALGWWGGGLAYLHVELWAQGDVIAFECNGTGVYLLEPGAISPKLLVGGDSVCRALGVQARANLDVAHGGLLYATLPPNTGIWRLDVRTGHRERLTPPSLQWIMSEPAASADTAGSTARTVAAGMSPAWSTDGRRLAFVKPVVPNRGYARTATLAIVDANGSGERVVFANSDTGAFTNGFEWIRNGMPSGPIVWDPQGKFMVFSRVGRGAVSLWKVNVDGTNLRRLTTPAHSQSN